MRWSAGLRVSAFACSLLLGALVLCPGAQAKAGLALGSWNHTEQMQVVRAGVMEDLSGGFGGEQSLSATQMQNALAALATRQASAPIAFDPSAPMTVVRFDALLVDQLGLGEAAGVVQNQAEQAGLHPPSYFGSEVLARYLDLRYMQPTRYEAFEPYPTDLITRAEAAHSFAAILGFSEWQLEQARETFASFALPRYNSAQRRVLSLAISKIGMPYIWGGTTDDTSDGLSHGGYDCSGFAWRVYKLSDFPWGRKINGRTAAQQAGEIPKRARLRLSQVNGGDLLFFGTAHFNSPAKESNVIHEGIALSDEWAIHSSDQGVYVLPLSTGWLHESFTWARRVL